MGLFQNRKFCDHADQGMQDTHDLVTAVGKDPQEYLSIRLKIF